MAHPKVAGPGWRFFAGTMMMVVGFFNIIDGLVAITNSQFFANKLLFSDLQTWGWIIVAIGALELVAGFAIFGASAFGEVIGIVVASLNAVAQLAWIQHHPASSILIIAIDVLVIYGLAMYGTHDRLEA